MLVYMLFFFFVVGAALVARKLPDYQSSILLGVIFFVLLLFAGLRGLVGSDTISYLSAYKNISDKDYFLYSVGRMEPLFVIFMWLHKNVFDSGLAYIFTMSLIQVVLLWKVCKYSSDKCLFLVAYVLIFYLNFHFNIARAAIASMLLLYSLCSRSRAASVLAAILAPGFHVSVLLFYPLFFSRLSLKVFSLFLLFCFFALVVFYEDFYEFSLKFRYYIDYLQGAVGFSLYGFLISINVLGSVLFLPRVGRLFLFSAFYLIVAVVAYSFYPIAYRFITIALLVYLFFLLETLSRLRYSWGYMFFWLPVILSFGILVYGISEERIILERRIASGEPLENALESTYLPYEFYWLDSGIDSL
ncbi:EpsG family protein [Pseudomonas sp. G34]|uniref:EpsG family protein n=1 Tax=Pseudomonas sp. G34 TaxID=3059083 RepID=UPI00280872F8|nr:EpsG family protein [Pseudomonas sp. G34]MDQ7985753.1 EpsG family protein [Pseudomonas sp. G34]